jgi:hypothetical protein
VATLVLILDPPKDADLGPDFVRHLRRKARVLVVEDCSPS